jgi:hypothetical protein
MQKVAPNHQTKVQDMWYMINEKVCSF